MLNLKKLTGTVLSTMLMLSILSCGFLTIAYASDTVGNGNEIIISHNKTWITPNKHVEVTIYDLGDGYTSTETITTEDARFGLLRAASGTKTQKSTVEIKNGSAVAATITVSGTFSYDGSKAKVTDDSHSKSVKNGYTETSWSTSKGNSGTFSSAYVSANLTVKNNSSGKSYSGSAKVTCSKNG